MCKNNLGRLSDTEAEVMQAIWELAAPITVTKLLDIFEKSKEWKTSTLSTILSRLIQKGFLTKTMSGKANIYQATLTFDEYKSQATKSFFSAVHGGSIKSFIAALADDNDITPDEIAELKQWFDGRG